METDGVSGDPLDEMQSRAIAQITETPQKLEDLDLELYADELESQNMMNMLPTLLAIKDELGTKPVQRQLGWRYLHGQELFAAMAGFYGRDVFAATTQIKMYQGENDPEPRVDQREARISLDCGLAGRIQNGGVDYGAEVVDFQYGVMLLYKLDVRSGPGCQISEDGRDRIMLDFTREPNAMRDTIDFRCGILCDIAHCISQKNEDTTIQKRASKIEWRAITHPDFQNVTHNGAKRFLESVAGSTSDFLIRPSSKGRDHLTLTIKFHDGIYLNVDILEHNRSATSSIGSPLEIDEQEYDDLDEIISRYVNPLVDHSRSVTNFRKFLDSSYEQIKAQMKQVSTARLCICKACTAPSV
jgi:hypothetical protein